MRRLLAAFSLVLAACLDLNLPSKAPPDPGPSVRFVSPADGQLIPLTSFLQLDITSLHGVKNAFVFCSPNLLPFSDAGVCGGGTLIQQWLSAAPFVATIDFSACAPPGVATQSGDGGPEAQTVICAQATDSNDVSGAARVSVRLDVASPALTIRAPNRVASGGTLTLDITSDRPLLGAPVVQVQGKAANVVGDPQNLHFVATLSPAPLLGIDAYDAGGNGDVPIEVLEDTERPLPITIDARGANGNSTHVSYQVLLSRVLWEKAVPGVIQMAGNPCPDDPLSVAGPSGLELPLFDGNHGPVTGGGRFRCVPGFLSASDGKFSPPPDVLDDAGTVFGFDLTGQSFFAVSAGLAILAPGTNAIQNEGVDPFPNAGRRLVPVGSSTLCQSQPVFAPCPTQVICLSADGGMTKDTAAPFSALSVVETSSGGSYFWYTDGLGTNCINANCPCSPMVAVGPPGAVVQRPQPFGATTLTNVLPIDGGFIVAYEFPQQVSFLTNQGALPNDSWNMAPDRPHAAFTSGRAISSVTYAGGYTVFSAWDKNTAPVPVASARIPGILEPASVRLAAIGPEGYVATDQKIAILVYMNPGMGILVLDSGMHPRWLYRYPGPANWNTVQLFGDPNGSLLYLLDVFGERAVALPW